MQRTGNTILITGGGSGIGEALAHRFHDLGNVVIIAGRRQDALDKAIEGRADMHAMTVDVEDPASITAFAKTVVERFPALNVLINNAGIMRRETVDTARDLADAEAMITTNVLGPIRLIDALVDHLATRADSVIVNVTSGLSFVPLIVAPTYSATKAAVHSYTMSLREVLKGKVEVIELAPPGVQTELTPGQATRAGYQPLEEFADEVLALFDEQPIPAEILVQRVRPLRFAERDDQVATLLAKVNAAANPE